MEWVTFHALVVVKNYSLFDLSEKRTSKAAWVVAFFNSCGLLAGGIFMRQCRIDKQIM